MNEVGNDPINLEAISALKKSVQRSTAAVNDLGCAIFGCNGLSPCGCCFFKKMKMMLNA